MKVDETIMRYTSEWTIPFEVHVKVKWPSRVTWEGQWYYATGKEGVRNGIPCAEYENDDRERVWLEVIGNIRPE